MSDLRWYRRLLSSTRGHVLSLLRRDDHTVAELAEDLNLTDNAIRSHLSALERDGMVRADRVRRDGVGKPARVYRLTPDAEEFFPKGYAPVLAGVLDVLRDRLGPGEVRRVLNQVAAREVARRGPGAGASAHVRLRAALDLLESLGAVVDPIRREDGGLGIQGHACPFGAVTADHPEVCAMVETLLERILERPVTECCDRGDRPRCAFEVGAAPAGD